ncbi:MAG: hypothetical protein IKP38_04215 [Clostridia bacterium]|nr:hypothetical protein [Clostridia bacterium]
MSLQDQLNSIKSQAKSNALYAHRDDSDDELRQSVVKCAELVSRAGTDIRGIGEGYRYMGEMEACSELLSQRKAADQGIAKQKSEWQNGLDKRKEEAILRLPNAVSANGQLIASILEDEDGKTAEEIACWCDELEMLPEEDLQKLLDDLVKEGVLSLEDGRYYLLCPCTESLICLEEIRNHRIDRNDDFYTPQKQAQAKLFLYMMEREKKPLCDTDCLDLLGRYFGRYLMSEEYQAAKEDLSVFDAERTLNRLADNGFIKEAFRMKNRSGDYKTYYWLTMLGEGK